MREQLLAFLRRQSSREQVDLLRWLRESIWPFEAAHTEASIAASTRLGVLELLEGGVTCINDMGTVRHTDAIAAA